MNELTMSVSEMGTKLKSLVALPTRQLLDEAHALARQIKTIKVGGDNSISAPLYSCEKCGHAPQKALLIPGEFWSMDALIKLPEWRELVKARRSDILGVSA